MKILIGTTNPSKIKRFEKMLAGYDAEFLTLKDFDIHGEPHECGNTPEKNAKIKAEFYGQYFDRVICNDSGLYFDGLDLHDPRQPGLNIRSPKGIRLNDEEMIEYYSNLVHSLGGEVLSYYLDGIAVYNRGTITSFMETGEAIRPEMFYMIDKPSKLRHEGWPLDSISVNRNTKTLFVDGGNNKYDTTKDEIILGEYRKRLVAFLVKSLGL